MTVHVTWNLPMLKITIGAEFTKVSTAKVSTASSLSPKWGVVWGTGVHVSSFNSSIQPVTCQTIWEVWQSFLTTRTFFHFIKIQLSSTFQFYKNIFHPEFQFCIISLHCREKKYRLFYFFFVCLFTQLYQNWEHLNLAAGNHLLQAHLLRKKWKCRTCNSCLVPIYIAERTENNFEFTRCVCFQNRIFRKDLALAYTE